MSVEISAKNRILFIFVLTVRPVEIHVTSIVDVVKTAVAVNKTLIGAGA